MSQLVMIRRLYFFNAVAAFLVIALHGAAAPARAEENPAPPSPAPGSARIDNPDYKGQAAIFGRLAWSTGAPAAGVTFDVIAYSRDDDQLKIGEVTTDAEGRYRVEGLRGKTARYRLFQKGDDDQRTFYIMVGAPDASTEYNWSLQPRVGDPAPEHVMPDFDGRPVDLKDHRGKIVVLKFWASWCGPCHDEMRRLAAEIKKREDWRERVVVIAISADERREAALEFIAENKLDGMIHLFEPGPRLSSTRKRGFRVGAIPFTFVLDSQGVVRYRSSSSQGAAEVIDALIQAPAASAEIQGSEPN